MWLMMVNDFSLSFSLVHVRQFYIISNRFMINYADENHTEYRIKPWIIDIAFRLNCSTLLAVHRLFLSGVAFSPICIYGAIFSNMWSNVRHHQMQKSLVYNLFCIRIWINSRPFQIPEQKSWYPERAQVLRQHFHCRLLLALTKSYCYKIQYTYDVHILLSIAT